MTRTNTRALANWPNNAVSVLDFGADPTGQTDSTAAIRLALDYMAARNGGTLVFGGGTFLVSDTIIIPITLTRAADNPDTDLENRLSGLIIDGTGCTIHCSESFRMPADRSTEGGGAVFETGQSNVSTGGVSNFGAGNEAFLHYNTIIKGFTFFNAGCCIKVQGFLKGCSIEHNTGKECNQLIIARRSFYCRIVHNNMNARVVPQIAEYNTNPSKACLVIESSANVMDVHGNTIGGDSDGITYKGIGMSFLACASMVVTNSSAEGNHISCYIGSQTYDLSIQGYWSEGDHTSIFVTGAARNLNISNCFLNATYYALNA